MKNFERITETPEALGAFLAALPIANGPWDDEFHKQFCADCLYLGCESCPHEKFRNNPLWWLNKETAQDAPDYEFSPEDVAAIEKMAQEERMATFVLTGLSIWKASEAAQLDLRQSLGGKFDVFVDWNNSPYVVKEPVKEVVDGETGKASSSFLMYSTVQFTPENIAAIKGVSGVKYCSARQDNLLPFEGLSLFPGTISTDAKYRGYTKTLGVCNTEGEQIAPPGTGGLLQTGEWPHPGGTGNAP